VILYVIPNILAIIISNIYSLKIHADDMEKTVFCFVSFGFVIKASIKFKNIVFNAEDLKKILQKCKKFHIAAAANNCEEIFIQNSKICDFVTRFFGILFLVVTSSIMINPIIIKLASGNLILPLGFELPFFDPSTTLGYAINYIFLIQLNYLACIGLSNSESYNAISMIPVFGAYQVLIEMVGKLEKFNNEKDEEQMIKRRNLLHEIIQIHQHLLDLIDDLENFHRSTNFICLGSNVIQCVASLFALITIRWYVGVVIVIMCISEIFIMCTFGAILEIMKEKFREKICEIDWVGKDKSECKKIIFMLLLTENDSTFTYIFGPLNFETFMGVRK
jgi:odorant receptor